QSWKLDFSTYPKGIYFIRLQSEGQIKVKRIIIQ
ncbi:MAG TPA: T9SS type A sorting domain-containing protein, partial [Saprospiraceae bacterium]|nr:T9SS type A sorting domain-containing protein [Saprospiraceae bacterium]